MAKVVADKLDLSLQSSSISSDGGEELASMVAILMEDIKLCLLHRCDVIIKIDCTCWAVQRLVLAFSLQ